MTYSHICKYTTLAYFLHNNITIFFKFYCTLKKYKSTHTVMTQSVNLKLRDILFTFDSVQKKFYSY